MPDLIRARTATTLSLPLQPAQSDVGRPTASKSVPCYNTIEIQPHVDGTAFLARASGLLLHRCTRLLNKPWQRESGLAFSEAGCGGMQGSMADALVRRRKFKQAHRKKLEAHAIVPLTRHFPHLRSALGAASPPAQGARLLSGSPPFLSLRMSGKLCLAWPLLR